LPNNERFGQSGPITSGLPRALRKKLNLHHHGRSGCLNGLTDLSAYERYLGFLRLLDQRTTANANRQQEFDSRLLSTRRPVEV
jgi:hypothetical protein